MADPTEAEIRLQIGYGIAALEEARQLAEADATNIIGIEEQLVANLEGDYSSDVLAGWQAFRGRFSDVLSQNTAFSVIAPNLWNYGKLINSPFNDPRTIFIDLYDYFVDNTLTVEKRGFTFGAASADAGNTGNGTIRRLNVDANGYDIDTQTADVKTIECVADEHSGADEHAEEFEIRSQERTPDFLNLKGGTGFPNSVNLGSLTAISAVDSASYLRNPSFTSSDQSDSDYAAGLATPGSTTGVTGWTLDSTTDVQLDRNTYYRDSEGETNPQALRFNANRYIQQNLNEVRATISNTGIGGFGQEMEPMFVQVSYYRGTNADGNLTLTFGNTTASVDVSTVANGAWHQLYIALGTGCWFENWNKEDPLLKIELDSNTVGYVNVDDVIVSPFTQFDGGWYVAVGGSTPFLRGDKFTCTDTVAETGVLQKWFVRSGLGYLPSAAAGAASWGDPPPTPTPSPTPTATPTPRTPTPTPTTTPTPTNTPTPTPTSTPTPTPT